MDSTNLRTTSRMNHSQMVESFVRLRCEGVRRVDATHGNEHRWSRRIAIERRKSLPNGERTGLRGTPLPGRSVNNAEEYFSNDRKDTSLFPRFPNQGKWIITPLWNAKRTVYRHFLFDRRILLFSMVIKSNVRYCNFSTLMRRSIWKMQLKTR